MKINGVNSLVLMSKASRLLAEADTIQKVKEFKNMALTAADYAKRKKLGKEAVQHAQNYALMAERKMGEILRETDRAKGTRGQLKGKDVSGGVHREPPEDDTPTLAELGITKKESSEAQLLAEVREEEFEKVKEGKKTKKAVLNEKRREKKREELKTKDLIPGEKKYRIIYADPPWKFQNAGFDESAEQQYPTMPIEKICALPVQDLIADKAAMFLWVPNAFLKEGLLVCDAWGFKYKTNLAWIKNKGPSIGWFAISRHELLFIATKGEGVHPTEKPISWFQSEATKHSRKPEQVYKMIESMYIGPYIELFARKKRDGWESWGNEI